MKIARKTKITAARARTMTNTQIRAAIFYGAGPGDARGPSDAFTPDAIVAIAARVDLPVSTVNQFMDAI